MSSPLFHIWLRRFSVLRRLVSRQNGPTSAILITTHTHSHLSCFPRSLTCRRRLRSSWTWSIALVAELRLETLHYYSSTTRSSPILSGLWSGVHSLCNLSLSDTASAKPFRSLDPIVRPHSSSGEETDREWHIASWTSKLNILFLDPSQNLAGLVLGYSRHDTSVEHTRQICNDRRRKDARYQTTISKLSGRRKSIGTLLRTGRQLLPMR